MLSGFDPVPAFIFSISSGVYPNAFVMAFNCFTLTASVSLIPPATLTILRFTSGISKVSLSNCIVYPSVPTDTTPSAAFTASPEKADVPSIAAPRPSVEEYTPIATLFLSFTRDQVPRAILLSALEPISERLPMAILSSDNVVAYRPRAILLFLAVTAWDPMAMDSSNHARLALPMAMESVPFARIPLPIPTASNP